MIKHSLGSSVGGAAILAIAASFVWLLVPTPAVGADLASGVIQLLQPGLPVDGGLSADPFATPLETDPWWRRASLAADHAARLRWTEQSPVTERLTQGGGRLTGRIVALDLGARRGWLSGVAHVTHRRLDLGIENSPDHNRLFAEGSDLALTIRATLARGRVLVQGSAPLAHTSGTHPGGPLGIGLQLQPLPRLSFRASWTEDRPAPDLDVAVADDRIVASLGMRRRRTQLAIDYAPSSAVNVAARAYRTDDHEQRPVTEAYRYEIETEGRSQGGLAVATISPAPRWSLALRGSYEEIDLEGAAFWGGQRFGTLSYIRGDLSTVLGALRHDLADDLQLRADVQLCRLRSHGRLSLRTWPFTDAVVDLLGITAVGKGRAHVTWERYHVTMLKEWRKSRASLGLSWFNILPDAAVRQTNSGPFGIGTEIENHELEVDHVQLGAVSLWAERRLGRWVLSGRLDQFVAARASGDDHTDDGEGGGGGGGGLAGSGDDDEHSGWYGGTFLRLSLSTGF